MASWLAVGAAAALLSLTAPRWKAQATNNKKSLSKPLRVEKEPNDSNRKETKNNRAAALERHTPQP